MGSTLHNWIPRGLFSAALVLAAWAAGTFPELFELERSGIARGELWRLWTGHLVHGSWAHFGYDVGAAVLLCMAFGPRLRLLWMAPLISVLLLVALPDVQYYYGLSALLHGWVVAITLNEASRNRGLRRGLALALLLGTLGKAALETLTGQSLFTQGVDFGGSVLHASHLIGGIVGLSCAAFRTPVSMDSPATASRSGFPRTGGSSCTRT